MSQNSNKVSPNQKLHLSDMKSENSEISIPKKKINEDYDEYTEKENQIENDNDSTMINLNYWYRGEQMQLVPDALKEISESQEVVIEQKIELLEILSGCETPNRYNVYLLDKDKTKKFLFKCKEESNWCCRNCCPSDLRSFTMTMIHILNSNKKNPNYKKTLLDFTRPFDCSFMCLCRPQFIAFMHNNNDNVDDEKNDTLNSQQGKMVGSVSDIFSCGPLFHVYGSKNEVRWKIYGEYCQCGFCCRETSLGKCYEVDFWIYDADADVKNSKPVGNVHKVFKGLSELITDSDAFILTFPKKATAIERIMLIGAVIMIDYRFYEDLACCDCISIL